MLKEIVGVQIGTKITNNIDAILQGMEDGTIRRLLSKQDMQLMAGFGLGENWDKLAKSPVLFLYDDETGDVVEAPIPYGPPPTPPGNIDKSCKKAQK